MKLGKERVQSRAVFMLVLVLFILPLLPNNVRNPAGSMIVKESNILVTSQFDANFTTYLGGDGQEDASKIALDAEGSTILIGQTKSDDFPVTPNAIQPEYSGSGEWDAFVAKFNPDGTLNFSTYLGGTQYEHITTVTSDDDLNVIVSGVTYSAGFPVTEDALHDAPLGSGDGFIMKMSPNGTLIYSTYFGSTGDEWIYGMEFDVEGNYMFSGYTTSFGLSTSGVYQESIGGGEDAFVAKLSADGQSILAFSYFGGISSDRGWCMTIDSDYNFLISGRTFSSDLPLAGNTYQESYGGGDDAFLAKISSDCTTLNFSTYLGGVADDVGGGIDVDGQDNVFLTGFTASDAFPVVNALQNSYGGGLFDGYFAKFNANGSGEFVSYFGGNKSDRIWDMRVDQSGNMALIGRTYSDDLPIQNALQPERAGLEDLFATKICYCGQIIQVSTYFGGTGTDFGEGIAASPDGHFVVSGMTYSNDIPITNNAYQAVRSGSTDAIIVHNIFDQPENPTTTSSVPTTTSSEATTTSTGSLTVPSETTSSTTPVTTDNTVILVITVGFGVVFILVIFIVMKRR